jgi:hypothetical protein
VCCGSPTLPSQSLQSRSKYTVENYISVNNQTFLGAQETHDRPKYQISVNRKRHFIDWISLSTVSIRHIRGEPWLRPASHRGGLGSLPGQCMWELWWTKWHWDRFFSEIFSFRLSISFYCGSPCSYITWGMNNRPVLVAAVQRRSPPHRHEQYYTDYSEAPPKSSTHWMPSISVRDMPQLTYIGKE